MTENRVVALRQKDQIDDPFTERGGLIAPFVPPARRGGCKREVDMREVLNGVFYVLSTGCQWSALPKDLPPKSTVHDCFILLDR